MRISNQAKEEERTKEEEEIKRKPVGTNSKPVIRVQCEKNEWKSGKMTGSKKSMKLNSVQRSSTDAVKRNPERPLLQYIYIRYLQVLYSKSRVIFFSFFLNFIPLFIFLYSIA